ncbi:MAG: VTT domain-containing protein [Myxococcota bacterium]
MASAEMDALAIPQLIRRLIGGLVGLLLIALIAGITLKTPIESLSDAFVSSLGLAGVFVGVVVLDALPFTTHEPLLLMGVQGGLGFWPVFWAAGTASVLSGIVGWGLGRLVGRSPFVRRMMHRYQIDRFLNRYGVWAVALAATTPFPFAACTWSCGAVGVPPGQVVFGSLFRYLKVLFYQTLLVVGFNLNDVVDALSGGI